MTTTLAMRYDQTMAREDLARWIYRFRIHLRMTQADFALWINTTMPTVQRWEYGTRLPTGPTLLLLHKLAAEHDFEPPPEVIISRGPRITNDEEGG